MPRKPIGVIVAAVALTLLSLLQLLSGAVSVLSGTLLRNPQNVTLTTPGAVQPSPGLVMAMSLIFGLFYCALAAWGIATAVGLFRMKNWARISIMIIGGLIAAFGLIFAGFFLIMPALLASQPMAGDPQVMAHLPLICRIAAVFFFAFALVGVWWLVYFALRSTRAAFATRPQQPYNIPAPPLTDASPYTDYTVAQPLGVRAPEQVQRSTWPSAPGAETPWQPAVEPWPPNVQPEVSTGTKRPVSMLILGVLLLIGSATAIFQLASPFPVFMFGMSLSGMKAHILMVVLGLLTGYCGLGLIKLERPAWFTTYGLFLAYGINSLTFLIPSVRTRMVDYMLQMTKTMQTAFPTPANTPNPTLDPRFYSIMMAFSAVFGVLLIAFLLILMHRARWAFETKADDSNPEAQAAE